MKVIFILAGAYSLAVGLSEIGWVATGSTALATLAGLPSAGSLIDSFVGSQSNANYIEGGVDTALGLGLLYFAMKG
jgi:hypothetical protein